MRTIISSDDIRKVRPIAENVLDFKRIDPYIREVEQLDVMPEIGISLYQQITDESFTQSLTENGSAVITVNGTDITVTREQWEKVTGGGYYTCGDCDCGQDGTRYSAGLTAAVAYLSYARALPNMPLNVTALGVVQKSSPHSEPVDDATLFRAAGEARKIGLEYLRQSAGHLRCLGWTGGRTSAKRFYRLRIIK